MGGKGSGGHNRKPTKRKQVEGNPGHRRLNKREPEARPGEPAMPAYLSPMARAIWRHLVPLLLEMKVLTRADGHALAMVCTSLVTVIRADRAIEKYGAVCATVDHETGVAILKANPAIRVRSDAMRHARSGLAAFGLDPASRSKLITESGGAGKPADPLDEFLNDDTPPSGSIQ